MHKRRGDLTTGPFSGSCVALRTDAKLRRVLKFFWQGSDILHHSRHPGSISDLCAGGDWRRCCFILAAEASSIFPDQLLANAMYTPADVLAILGFSCVVAILVGFSFWRIGERR